jgi:hypothetical protein
MPSAFQSFRELGSRYPDEDSLITCLGFRTEVLPEVPILHLDGDIVLDIPMATLVRDSDDLVIADPNLKGTTLDDVIPWKDRDAHS